MFSTTTTNNIYSEPQDDSMDGEKPYRIKFDSNIPVEAVLEILPKEEISFLNISEMKPSVNVMRNKKNLLLKKLVNRLKIQNSVPLLF